MKTLGVATWSLIVVFLAWNSACGLDCADLTKVSIIKSKLDEAAAALKSIAQGNEGGVSVKAASAKNVVLDYSKMRPTSGTVCVTFDVHHRHRISPDRELVADTPLGKFTTHMPGVVAYDRHDEIQVEYDLKNGRGRARGKGADRPATSSEDRLGTLD